MPCMHCQPAMILPKLHPVRSAQAVTDSSWVKVAVVSFSRNWNTPRHAVEVAGVGMSADAHHLTASHPEGLGAKLVMLNALEDAEMKPEEVDYINVHGTSTPVGDISEAKAIKEVFGQHAYELNISSTKSMTGHLLGAAGAVESIASILAIKNGIVPPTINHEEGDNDENIDYDLNFTFNKAQKREVNVALSNTFGFGGHNACVIFKKYAE